NISMTNGLVYSQRVLTFLLDELKLSREDAYAIVQENAMKTASSTTSCSLSSASNNSRKLTFPFAEAVFIAFS
ncbi:MAG: hypothetical protein IJG34_00555, partial [Synergistaceae bacterium]|nr:hypothetical protein [Synergistaceae bacterium]